MFEFSNPDTVLPGLIILWLNSSSAGLEVIHWERPEIRSSIVGGSAQCGGPLRSRCPDVPFFLCPLKLRKNHVISQNMGWLLRKVTHASGDVRHCKIFLSYEGSRFAVSRFRWSRCGGKFLHALDCFDGCSSLSNLVCTGEHPVTRTEWAGV